MRVTRLTGVLLTALHLAAATAGGQPRDTATLSDVSVEERDGTVSVTISTSGASRHQSTVLDRPPRVVLDFAGAEFAWTRSPMAVAAEPVREIRGSQYRKGVARIVIELTRNSVHRLEPRPDGLRVVFPPARVEPAGAAPARPAPARPEPAPPVPAAARPVLYGVIYGERGWIAYIHDPATAAVSAYRVGDTVAGQTIEAIEDERVTLKGPEGLREIRLNDDKPGSIRRPR